VSVKTLIEGGGDALARQKVLGKGLGAFQLRGVLRGAPDVQAGGGKGIHHAVHQRRFRADDGQVDAIVLGELHELVVVQDV
jgi:hypothetical protein